MPLFSVSKLLKDEEQGFLTKIARVFNSENLLEKEYKTYSPSSVGVSSLLREFIYDTRGNIVSDSTTSVVWTQTQEDIATGASATVIEAAGANVTAATKTTYSTSTTAIQYWLGLKTDGQLTKEHIGTATSTKQILHYALPDVAVGDNCLQRVNHIDSSVITSYVDILGVWSQAMQDIAAPAISDITLSAAITVEDQLVGVDIGTLATAGSNTGHGTVVWTLTSTTLTGDKLRIGTGADVNKLEVGPNTVGAADAGTYNAVIKATDDLGAYREETFVITVTSNNITDIALSAATIPYGSNADTAIGTLSYSGGVGTLSPVITSAGGMTNLRLDGNVLEAGPSWMNTAAGAHTVRITVTDEAPTPQTYYEDFTITVSSTAITDIALTAASINYGDAADTAIGTLSFTGGVSTVTPTISNAGGMTNLRLDGNVLEAGPSWMNTAAGTYSVTILATDTRGQTYSESFTITVVSTAITDLALSALTVLANAVENDLIGNITDTGGHGTVTYAITTAGGLDNIRIDVAKLEVGSGGIIDSAGDFTVRITATDDVSQTYFEDFTITVQTDFHNLKAMTRTTTDADYVYFDHGQADASFGSGSGNFYVDDWLPQATRGTDNYTMSLWFKITGTPDTDTIYGLLQSGAQYGSTLAGGFLFVSNKSGTNGPNIPDDGTFKVGTCASNKATWYTPASSVDVADGEWHHYVRTWNDANMTDPTSGDTSPNSAQHMGGPGGVAAANLKVYIDGEVCVYHANEDYGITASIRNFYQWNAVIGGYWKMGFNVRASSSNEYTDATTPNMYGLGFGYMKLGATLETNYDEFSFHNIELTAAQVVELYNSGEPVSLETDDWTAGTWATTNCLAWFRMFEGDNDNDTTIVSVASGPNGDGTVNLYDWDAVAEEYVTSDPARTVTPTIKIKNGTGDEVITLTALADGDVFIA